MPDSIVQVVIVGAGAYGLSIAAHLREAGMTSRIIGRPMQNWHQMSPGMHLNSQDFATSIHTPGPGYTFPQWNRDAGLESADPCPISQFADYGSWLAQELIGDCDPTQVVQVAQVKRSFEVTLATGERIESRKVVVATGLTGFQRLPLPLEGLGPELVSHTSNQTDFSAFRGRRVAVLGAGQSALEAAVLLREAGADADLHVRGAGAYFGGRLSAQRSLRERFRSPNSLLGPGRRSWLLCKFPGSFHRLPAGRRLELVRSHLGPRGAWWLAERFASQVPVHAHHQLESAFPIEHGLRLVFATPRSGDAVEIDVDHVVCGTGYDVDLDRLPFLYRGLVAQVARLQRAPDLSPQFESSVEGLYFTGPIAAPSHGPLLRFVAGTGHAAPVIVGHIRRSLGQTRASRATKPRMALLQRADSE